MTKNAYIGLGSNLEQPRQQVAQAIEALREFPASQLLHASSLYISKPWGEGVADQPDYINAVVCLQTQLDPNTLLKELLALEKRHGRVRTQRYGARTLDCDLLLYGNEQIATQTLIVPHPHITSRAFVLLPLLEIDPKITLPSGKPIQDYLAFCDDSQVEKILEQDRGF